MPTRCFMPPESCSGKWFSKACRPATDNRVRAVASRSVLPMPCIFRPNSTFWRTVFPGKEGVLLEHHAAVGAGAADRFAVHQDGARGGPQEPGDGVEDGGFPAAGGADEGDELARLDMQGHFGDGGVSAEADGELADLDMAAREVSAHVRFPVARRAQGMINQPTRRMRSAGGEAEHADADHAEDDLGVFDERISFPGEVANAELAGDHFGGDEGDPGDPHADGQSGEDLPAGRRGARLPGRWMIRGRRGSGRRGRGTGSTCSMPMRVLSRMGKKEPRKVIKTMLSSLVGHIMMEMGTQAMAGMGRRISKSGRRNSRRRVQCPIIRRPGRRWRWQRGSR